MSIVRYINPLIRNTEMININKSECKYEFINDKTGRIMLTSEQKQIILDGFIETMIEDLDHRLQDSENIFGSVPIIVEKQQKDVIKSLLDHVLRHVNLNIWLSKGYQGLKDFGGDLYIGFIYDCSNCALADLVNHVEWYCDVYAFLDDSEIGLVEGYLTFDNVQYSL